MQYRIDEDRAARELRAANLSFVRDKASLDTNVVKPFNNLDLRYQQMDGLQLTGADFDGANLDGSRFRGTILGGAILRRVSAHGADFRGAIFVDNISRRDEDDRLDYPNALMEDGDFTGAIFAGAMMPLLLGNATFRNADFRFAAFFNDTDFTGSDLRGANLMYGQLGSAVFASDGSDGTPVGSDLTGANLAGANLSNVRLGDTAGAERNSDLITVATSNMSKRMQNPELEWQAFMDNPDMDYRDEILRYGARVVDVCYNQETKWPVGFTPPPNNLDTCRKFSVDIN